MAQNWQNGIAELYVYSVNACKISQGALSLFLHHANHLYIAHWVQNCSGQRAYEIQYSFV